MPKGNLPHKKSENRFKNCEKYEEKEIRKKEISIIFASYTFYFSASPFLKGWIVSENWGIVSINYHKSMGSVDDFLLKSF